LVYDYRTQAERINIGSLLSQHTKYKKVISLRSTLRKKFHKRVNFEERAPAVFIFHSTHHNYVANRANIHLQGEADKIYKSDEKRFSV